MKRLFVALLMLITINASAQWVQMNKVIDDTILVRHLAGNNVYLFAGIPQFVILMEAEVKFGD